MDVTRYARKRDANHTTIARALERLGVWVWHTEGVGGGFPDLLTWTGQRGFVLLELKSPGSAHAKAKPGGKSNSSRTAARQAAFRAVCPGPVHVVTTLEEALIAVGLRRAA